MFSYFTDTVIKLLASFKTPIYEGTIKVKGIISNVEIRRDVYGVPHIYAENEKDVLFGQGFAHAQERLWQMELLRRISQGRLSEISPEAILTDRLSRTIGYYRLGCEDAKKASKKFIELLQSYIDGINTYLESNFYKAPLEFSLVGISPEKWKVEDSLGIGRLISFMMSRGFIIKIINLAVSQKMEKAFDLKHHQFPYTIDEIEINTKEMLHIFEKLPPTDQGSNSWAISSDLTKSGAILASDPHLGVGIPCVWYEQHLICKDFNLFGVSIPGGPYVSIGHNEFIAWGVTLSFADVCEIYIEKIEGNKYQTSNGLKDLEIIEERIKVKGQEDIIEKVRLTRHGPIISHIIDQQLKIETKTEFSLCAPYCQRNLGPDFEPLSKLVKSKNWDEFCYAVRNIETLSLNITYADNKGNIGYHLTGRIPNRSKLAISLANYPVPGYDDSCEWNNYIAPEELPHTFNPKKGFVVSANHNIIDPKSGYKHYLGDCWKSGIRADRITTMIQLFYQKNGKVTVDDCRKIQLDEKEDHQIVSKKVLEKKIDIEKEFKNSKQSDFQLDHVELVLRSLLDWNGSYDVDSIGASINLVFIETCLRKCLSKKLGDDLTNLVLGCGLSDGSLNEYHSHESETLRSCLDNETNSFIFDAILDTIRKIREMLGLKGNPTKSEVEKYKYGNIHQISFNHPFGKKISSFNRGPFPIGGSANTPNNQSYFPNGKSFNVCVYPSYRMIVDMNHLDEGISIFAPGQSGHIFTEHYDDLIEPFIKGKYKKMFWNKDKVIYNQKGQINLN